MEITLSSVLTIYYQYYLKQSGRCLQNKIIFTSNAATRRLYYSTTANNEPTDPCSLAVVTTLHYAAPYIAQGPYHNSQLLLFVLLSLSFSLYISRVSSGCRDAGEYWPWTRPHWDSESLKKREKVIVTGSKGTFCPNDHYTGLIRAASIFGQWQWWRLIRVVLLLRDTRGLSSWRFVCREIRSQLDVEPSPLRKEFTHIKYRFLITVKEYDFLFLIKESDLRSNESM